MTTGIQWTDETWNPVTGCTKVSPGCANCYAEGVAMRFWGKQYRPRLVSGGEKWADLKSLDTIPTSHHDGYLAEGFARTRRFTDVMCHEDRLDQPLRWKRPRRIFVNSMSDLFHKDVPDAFIDRAFAVMALAPQHTFQILTKRPQRMRDYLTRSAVEEVYSIACRRDETLADRWRWPLPNVWLGVSVENQHFADERILLLLRTPAAVRFISAEPLLGRVDISPFLLEQMSGDPLAREGFHRPPLDWVIVGGESGKGARPFNVGWARSIVGQCRAAGVAVFIKQFGADIRDRNDAGFDGCELRSWPEAIEQRDAVEDHIHGFREDYQGAEVRIHLINRKGGDPSEWPEDLRVREFPEVRA